MIGTKGITATQAEAIRRFFTHPQERYSEAEARGIFGNAYPLDDYDPPFAAKLIGDFMRGYLSPNLPGAVLGDEASDMLKLERLTIHLPAWQVRALEQFAAEVGGTISDAIALDLYGAHDGAGVLAQSSEAFEDAEPSYVAEVRHA